MEATWRDVAKLREYVACFERETKQAVDGQALKAVKAYVLTPDELLRHVQACRKLGHKSLVARTQDFLAVRQVVSVPVVTTERTRKLVQDAQHKLVDGFLSYIRALRPPPPPPHRSSEVPVRIPPGETASVADLPAMNDVRAYLSSRLERLVSCSKKTHLVNEECIALQRCLQQLDQVSKAVKQARSSSSSAFAASVTIASLRSTVKDQTQEIASLKRKLGIGHDNHNTGKRSKSPPQKGPLSPPNRPVSAAARIRRAAYPTPRNPKLRHTTTATIAGWPSAAQRPATAPPGGRRHVPHATHSRPGYEGCCPSEEDGRGVKGSEDPSIGENSAGRHWASSLCLSTSGLLSAHPGRQSLQRPRSAVSRSSAGASSHAHPVTVGKPHASSPRPSRSRARAPVPQTVPAHKTPDRSHSAALSFVPVRPGLTNPSPCLHVTTLQADLEGALSSRENVDDGPSPPAARVMPAHFGPPGNRQHAAPSTHHSNVGAGSTSVSPETNRPGIANSKSGLDPWATFEAPRRGSLPTTDALAHVGVFMPGQDVSATRKAHPSPNQHRTRSPSLGRPLARHATTVQLGALEASKS